MIKAEGLSMRYGPVVALNDVSFNVEQGEIVALLGPNGAGKSTTMKILTTYLHPTAGTAKINEFDVLENPIEARAQIGYLPETLPLYMDMEVRSYLTFVGKARGLRGATLKDRMDLVVQETGLQPMYRKLVRDLSKGYKQRTALAQALIHDPSVVILDEPTSGLDPHQIVEIRQLVKNLARGKTVLLSTHILQEVEASADRVVIISQGRIVGNGTVEELRQRAKKRERVRIAVQGDAAVIERELSALSGATNVERRGAADGYAQFVVFAKPGTELWQEVSGLARSKNWPLRELYDQPLSLEETFLTLTEGASEVIGKGGEA